ncbi:hypothetical protein HXX76_012598 [Chlamydomonas incerta]|uniref:EGF-like domain-containing protein n=1 Tax=Chlamydomonas incerta TaxID=51695 RepID=A0A835SH22_CHLIN|nr:hypothetical protein HXX76_012598 [Chlamydomonas incerta]|eukprot:KAG2427087.1 hypothetical protein HXX76_012598 [Chlamydomonas incerta]
MPRAAPAPPASPPVPATPPSSPQLPPRPPLAPPPMPEFLITHVAPLFLRRPDTSAGGTGSSSTGAERVIVYGRFDVAAAAAGGTGDGGAAAGGSGGVTFTCIFRLAPDSNGSSGTGWQYNNSVVLKASATSLSCLAPPTPPPAPPPGSADATPIRLQLQVARSPARVASLPEEILPYDPPLTYYEACPADCSGRGMCMMGVCSCQADWRGADCATPAPDIAITGLGSVEGSSSPESDVMPGPGGLPRFTLLERGAWRAQPLVSLKAAGPGGDGADAGALSWSLTKVVSSSGGYSVEAAASLEGVGMRIDAATGAIEWPSVAVGAPLVVSLVPAAGVSSGGNGNGNGSSATAASPSASLLATVTVAVTALTAWGKSATYTLQLAVVPLYGVAELRVPAAGSTGAGNGGSSSEAATATAPVVAAGGLCAMAGRLGYSPQALAWLESAKLAAGAGAAAPQLPGLGGLNVTMQIWQVAAAAAAAAAAVGGGAGGAAANSSLVSVLDSISSSGSGSGSGGVDDNWFDASWKIPVGLSGAVNVFAYPTAWIQQAAASGGSSAATQPLSQQLTLAVASLEVAIATAAWARLDPRQAAPTLHMAPGGGEGGSVLLQPFARAIGSLQDVQDLQVNISIRRFAPALSLPGTGAAGAAGGLKADAVLPAEPATTVCTAGEGLAGGLLDGATTARLCGGGGDGPAASQAAVAGLGLQLQTAVDLGAVGDYEVSITVRGSASGATSSLLLRVVVDEPRVALVTDPPGSRLAVVLRPGGVTSVQVTLTNSGNVASGPLVLSQPLPGAWCTVSTPSPVPSLAPGADTTLTYQFRAPDGAPLGSVFRSTEYIMGSAAAGDSSGGTAPQTPLLELRTELTVALEPLGDLQVAVVDEFTTYDPAEPKVAGARLVLTSSGGSIAAEGRTNASGIFVFTDLLAGAAYTLTASATNHTSATRAVTITGGPRSLRVFLPRTAVRVTFAVVPSPFKEEVTFVSHIEYVTFVPMPVVIMDPPLLIVDDMIAAGGQTMRLTNMGLVAAFNVRLKLPYTSQMFRTNFLSATWVQIENVTVPAGSPESVASVMFFPPGSEADTAWASAEGAAAPPTAAASSGNINSTSSSNSTAVAVPEDGGRTYWVMVIGRMPAISELVIEISTSATQAYVDMIRNPGGSGRHRRSLQYGGGGYCSLAETAYMLLTDPCDRAKTAWGWNIPMKFRPAPASCGRWGSGAVGTYHDQWGNGNGGGGFPRGIMSSDNSNIGWPGDFNIFCDACIKELFDAAKCLLDPTSGFKDFSRKQVWNLIIKCSENGKRVCVAEFILTVAENIPKYGCIVKVIKCKPIKDAIGNGINGLMGWGKHRHHHHRSRQLLELGQSVQAPKEPDPGSPEAVMASLMQGGAGGAPFSEAKGGGGLDTPKGRLVQRWSVALTALYVAALEAYGEAYFTEWLESKAPLELRQQWQAAWADATADRSPAGMGIDWVAEAPALLGPAYDGLVTAAARTAAIARWNATYAGGVEFAAPAGALAAGLLPIDTALMESALQLYAHESEAAAGMGFTSLEHALADACDAVAAVHIAAAVGAGDGFTCARVVIRIDQRLVLTRQAFEASLVFDNTDGNTALGNITVTLTAWLKDNGTIATRAFAFGEPRIEGFEIEGGGGGAPASSANGTATSNTSSLALVSASPAARSWSLPAGARGAAYWTLIPRDAAALAGDTWYDIGGEITYTPQAADGAGVSQQLPAETIPLEPADVRVSPEGRLAVRYYIEKLVQGDNPFTPEPEPSVPAAFVTLLSNIGTGPLAGLAMDSAQPAIVENEKGLLVRFNITAVTVNGLQQPRALRADIGDVAPGRSAMVIWKLRASLQGTFSAINATYTSRNPLNDPSLSSVASLDIFDMLHLVYLEDGAGGLLDDGLPDMLVTGGGSDKGSPYVPTNTSSATMDAALPLPSSIHSSAGGAVVPVRVVPEEAVAEVAAAAAAAGSSAAGAVEMRVRIDGSKLLPSGGGAGGSGGAQCTGGVNGSSSAAAEGCSSSGWWYLRVHTPDVLKPSSRWVVSAAAVAVAEPAGAAAGAAGGGGGTEAALRVPYNAWATYRAYKNAAAALDVVQVLYDGFVPGGGAAYEVRLTFLPRTDFTEAAVEDGGGGGPGEAAAPPLAPPARMRPPSPAPSPAPPRSPDTPPTAPPSPSPPPPDPPSPAAPGLPPPSPPLAPPPPSPAPSPPSPPRRRRRRRHRRHRHHRRPPPPPPPPRPPPSPVPPRPPSPPTARRAPAPQVVRLNPPPARRPPQKKQRQQ